MSLFFRLLVVELGRRARRLPAPSGYPPHPETASDLWSELRTLWKRLEEDLEPAGEGPQSPHPAHFAHDPFQAVVTPGDAALRQAMRAVGGLGSGAPYETLTSIYSDVLRHRPSIAAASYTFVLEREPMGRKASGAFYTPLPVARLVVGEALRPLLERDSSRLPRVLDPSMGTGAFLLETVRYLHDYLQERGAADGRDISPARIAAHCLHGVDRDPLAVQLAIHALWLETGALPGLLTRRLQCGDPLAGAPAPSADSYDAVIGNPPWGGRPAGGAGESDGRRRPPTEQADRFKLFLHLGATLTRGTLGMVVPQAVLAQTAHADIRRELLAHFDPYCVMDLGNHAFPAAAPACALVFGPRPGPAQVRHTRLGPPSSLPPVWSVLPRSQCGEGGFLLAGADLVELCAHLQRCHPALGAMSSHVRVRDVGINYNRASVARRLLYLGSEPADQRDVPRYRGRDFDRYTSVRRGGWLRYDAMSQLREGEHLSLTWATYRLPEKIVLRQTADRLIATLDCSRMAMGRSVIALTPESDVSLRALLACLNSRLLTVLYRALSGEEGRLLPQVKVGRLTALPVPAICSTPLSPRVLRHAAQTVAAALEDGGSPLLQRVSHDSLSIWAALDRLAELLLQAEGRDSTIDTLIDQLVYRLYGLTPQQIKTVENIPSLDIPDQNT